MRIRRGSGKVCPLIVEAMQTYVCAQMPAPTKGIATIRKAEKWIVLGWHSALLSVVTAYAPLVAT